MVSKVLARSAMLGFGALSFWGTSKIYVGTRGNDVLQDTYISAQTKHTLLKLEAINRKPFEVTMRGNFQTVSRWSSGNTNMVVCDIYCRGIERDLVQRKWTQTRIEPVAAAGAEGVFFAAIHLDDGLAIDQYHERLPTEDEFRVSLVFYIEPSDLREWFLVNLD